MSIILTKIGIYFFRLVRFLKKILEYFFINILFDTLRPIGNLLYKILVFPVYSLVIKLRIKLQKLALPARGFVLFLITNKYLFHIALVLAVGATVYTNLKTNQVLAQDAGRKSLLYTIMTNGESEIIHENCVLDLANKKRVQDKGTIQAIPHIDFDYFGMSPEDNKGNFSTASNLEGVLVLKSRVSDNKNIFNTPNTRDTVLASANNTNNTIVTNISETKYRDGIIDYKVRSGDSLGLIAKRYNIDVGTIIWANGLTARSLIRPGDVLKILPVSGVVASVKKGDTLSALARRYNAEISSIKKVNHLSNGIISVGQQLIIPDGEPPAIVKERTVAIARSQTKTAVLKEKSSSKAVHYYVPEKQPSFVKRIKKPADKVEKKTKKKAKLLWPTSGHVITQYYGWRHTGLDIDGDYTSPLYASEDGVVKIAGWNKYGYGLQVLIQHPNGMKTRYAHASKIFVRVGDHVKRGQVIAMMGSTGHSTGSHIHYEVYVNGRRVNPLLYIR